MSKDDVRIRSVRKKEIDRLLELLEQHAAYEQSTFDPKGKSSALTRDIFELEKLWCLVAEMDAEIVGYATYTIQYCTWSASEYAYMDCLYLVESARGRGIGLELMRQIKNEVMGRSIELIQWQTPAFNEGAIRFYKRLGATALDKERFFWKLNSDEQLDEVG